MTDRPLFLRDDLPHGSKNGSAKHAPGPDRRDYTSAPAGDAYEEQPPYDGPPDGPPPTAQEIIVAAVSMRVLLERNPEMRQAVIDGLIRQGETMNIIAPPKFGKSWLVLSLLLAVATGRPWLGYPTTQGDVLLIDNELHPETLASRLRRVAEAYGVPLDEVGERIQILSLRGRLQDLVALGRYFRSLPAGKFKLVVVDAFYRSVPSGTDENSNGSVAALYNLIDSYADHLGACFVNIHHTSKGNQSEKGITDVGAGAGSQSRAADAHVVLRQHEEDDVYVMDAVVRSFAPMAPKCLRWAWPFFTVAEGLDPAALAKTTRKAKIADPDAEAAKEAAANQRDKDDDAKLLGALESLDPGRKGANYTRVRELARLGSAAMTRATQRLVDEGFLEEIPFMSDIGSGAKKPSRGLRRTTIGTIGKPSV